MTVEKLRVTAIEGERDGARVLRIQCASTALWVTEQGTMSADQAAAKTIPFNRLGKWAAMTGARAWAASKGFVFVEPKEGDDHTGEMAEVGGPPPHPFGGLMIAPHSGRPVLTERQPTAGRNTSTTRIGGVDIDWI